MKNYGKGEGSLDPRVRSIKKVPNQKFETSHQTEDMKISKDIRIGNFRERSSDIESSDSDIASCRIKVIFPS